MDDIRHQRLQAQIGISASCVVADCFVFALVAGMVVVWHGLGRLRAATWWSSTYTQRGVLSVTSGLTQAHAPVFMV